MSGTSLCMQFWHASCYFSSRKGCCAASEVCSSDHAEESKKMSDKSKVYKFTQPTTISALLLAASLGVPAFAQTSSSSNAQVQTGATASSQPAGQANAK